MGRLARQKDAGRSFDLDFWDKVGAEGRFAAAWEMIGHYLKMRGCNERQSRLQRSVQSVQRR